MQSDRGSSESATYRNHTAPSLECANFRPIKALGTSQLVPIRPPGTNCCQSFFRPLSSRQKHAVQCSIIFFWAAVEGCIYNPTPGYAVYTSGFWPRHPPKKLKMYVLPGIDVCQYFKILNPKKNLKICSWLFCYGPCPVTKYYLIHLFIYWILLKITAINLFLNSNCHIELV